MYIASILPLRLITTYCTSVHDESAWRMTVAVNAETLIYAARGHRARSNFGEIDSIVRLRVNVSKEMVKCLHILRVKFLDLIYRINNDVLSADVIKSSST